MYGKQTTNMPKSITKQLLAKFSMTNAKAGDMYVKGFMPVLKPIFETPTVR